MMRAMPHRFHAGAEVEVGEKKRAELDGRIRSKASSGVAAAVCAEGIDHIKAGVLHDATAALSHDDAATKHASGDGDVSSAIESSSHSPAVDEKEKDSRSSVKSSVSRADGAAADMDTKDDGASGATAAAAAVKDSKSSDTPAAPAAAAASSSAPVPVWSSNSVIMLDWDDTLLASSFLSGRGYRVDSASPAPADADPNDAAQLKALEQAVCALIRLALSYGHVNIVTNAETGWVELSAQKFMPAVVPLLSQVTVLSARSTYEPAHPDAPLKWKFYAFHERLRAAFGAGCMDARVSDSSEASGVTPFSATSTAPITSDKSEMKKNIVSFGDSHVEREAIRAVTRGVSGWRCKSVKFAERPTVEQLRRQLELVSNCFHYIVTHPADLDLQLTVTLHTTPSTTAV
jgi:hypothetical protein